MPEKVIANWKGKIEVAIADGSFVELTNVTNCSPSVDQETQERYTFGSGWKKSFVTAKSLEVSFETTFDADNAGHQYLRGLALGDPIEQNDIKFKITFPIEIDTNTTPAVLELNGAISFSDILAGAAEELTPLNFTLAQSGDPVYTAEAA